MDYRIRRAAWNTESLERRQLLASISGTVVEDLDFDNSRDGREDPIAGVVIFLDQNKNRQLDTGEQSTVTDVNGFYEFTGLAEGDYFVAQLPARGHSQSYPTKEGFADITGDFDIDLVFKGNSLNTKGRSLFESAAARWEEVIIGDISDFEDEDLGKIDDIQINARAVDIDGRFGTLARAGPDLYRPTTAETPILPYLASMEFDTADLNDDLFETILHEMGHALGFTLFTWFQFEDLEIDLIGGTNSQPLFLGENAVREYNALFNFTAPKLGVPLEDFTAGSGSAFSHFAENVFDFELMTPESEGDLDGEPLSRLTLGLMQDIGYEVDYRFADPYDPTGGRVPPINPPNDGAGLLDFSYTVRLESNTDAERGRDFISRLNTRPTIDAVRAGNSFYEVGDIVKLRAVGGTDSDSGDFVQAMNFYLESNNIAGLQVGAGGDTYVGADSSPDGGFRLNVNTTTFNIPAGSATFYARPLDQLFTFGKPKQVNVSVFNPDAPPSKPTSIIASPRSSSSTLVSWNDRSNNEFGFRVERSRDPFFIRGVQRFQVAANVDSFLDTGLGAATEYFYRVRAFNVGGASGFAGPASAITLSPHEVVVDDQDEASVSADGPVTTANDANSRGGTFALLDGPGAIVRFAPQLTQTGRYYVYASWARPLVGSAQSPAVFSITDIEGDVRSITIDQISRGRENSEVLLGQFSFKKGNRTIVRVTSAGQDIATIDQLRFVPIG